MVECMKLETELDKLLDKWELDSPLCLERMIAELEVAKNRIEAKKASLIEELQFELERAGAR